jgi:hypothetical protein
MFLPASFTVFVDHSDRLQKSSEEIVEASFCQLDLELLWI